MKIINKCIILVLTLLSVTNQQAISGSIKLDNIISHYKKYNNYQYTDSCISIYVDENQFDTSDDIKKELDFYRFAASFYKKSADAEYAYALYDKYLYSLELNELNKTNEYCEALIDLSLVCLSMPKWYEALGYCNIADSIAHQNHLSHKLYDKINNRIELIQLLYGITSTKSENYSVNNISTDQLMSKLLYDPNIQTVNLLKERLFNIEKSTYQDMNEMLYVSILVAIGNFYINNSLYRDLDALIIHVRDFVNQNKKPITFYGYVKYLAGRMFLDQGLYEEALTSLNDAKASFEKFQILSPSYFRLLETLSLCYLELQDKDNAIATVNLLSSLFENKQNNVGNALYYEYKTINSLIGVLTNNCSINDAINDVWVPTYEATLNKKGLLNDVHNLTIKILCLFAKTTDNRQILKELLEEVKESNMSIINKIKLSELLYDYKWKESDRSIINDVAFDNSYIQSNIISDLCYYSEMERSDLWFEDASKLTMRNFLLEKYHDNDSVCKMCYDNALLVKNMKINSDIILRTLARNANDSILMLKINTIDSLKSQIVYSRWNLIEPTTLSGQVIEEEKSLVKRLLSPEQIKTYIHTWGDVKKSLNNDEVAVEIVPIFPLPNTQSYPMSFAALIITNESESPKCVLIGSIEDYKFELAKAVGPDKYLINDLYSHPNNIFNLCWKQIQPELKGRRIVYLSTCFSFSAINFSAIKVNERERIGDVYEIHNVISTNSIVDRNLLRQGNPQNTIVLYGNAKFQSNQLQVHHTKHLGELSEQKLNKDKTRGNLGFLIGTKIEIDTLYELLSQSNYDVKNNSGDLANEKSFRNMSGDSPYVLHVATHGFNLSNPFNAKDVKSESISSELVAYNRNQFAMLYTGLLLSNETVLSNESPSAYNNDGILLSEDIAKLDLSNTGLVVISACQSGRGDNMNPQGIIGLPRAFKLAGAKKVLCSLWDVDDEATAHLMINFYRYFLIFGSEHKALIKAQSRVKELYPDPYYWAGFILLE